MAHDLYILEARYLNSCRKKEVQPNSSILSSFRKVKHQNMCQGHCALEIIMDQLVYTDFPPLVAALSTVNLSAIDAVDVYQESSGIMLNGECVLSLLDAVSEKLRNVDLIDWSYSKSILRYLCRRGLPCQMLNLQSSPLRKLDMTGKFMQMHTLNLDLSVYLSSFDVNCFICMPKLMRLSMCGTRVANLWMTSAALSKLPSLVELRFQNCLCCYDTRLCPNYGLSVTVSAHRECCAGQLHLNYTGPPSVANRDLLVPYRQDSSAEEVSSYLYSTDDSFTNHAALESTIDESSDDTESVFLNIQDMDDWMEMSYTGAADLDGQANSGILESSSECMISYGGTSLVPTSSSLEDCNNIISHETLADICSQLNDNSKPSSGIFPEYDEGCSANMLMHDNTKESSGFSPGKHNTHHPSPICFEQKYREYMISTLSRLKVLDNLPVKNVERQKASSIFKKYYEHLPYNRHYKESVVSILTDREVGSSNISRKSSRSKQSFSRDSCHSFSRSLSAAKVSSSPLPSMHSISNLKNGSMEEIRSFRPRQFEYHPTNPSLMVFGTLDGELVVMNHESQKLVGYLPSGEIIHSILGLCWLKKYPSKLIAGSDNGSLQLHDVCKMAPTVNNHHCSMDAALHTFDEFEQLTSVHINSTDECIIASGFSKHVALYDMGTGRRLQIFNDLHREHINVVKFAHHSPNIFATASFDQKVKLWDLRQGPSRPCYAACNSRGSVMACFSPDDHYLLTSAIDNEVKQLLAVDGRLHMAFDISSTGSAQNYTRSYYMNGRDYIISGSCEESVVRICCAQTGRRLRDISLEGRGSRNSVFVQSLRGDPFRVFHMSVLAAYSQPTSSEIIKVNLLGSKDSAEDEFCRRPSHASYGMGG